MTTGEYENQPVIDRISDDDVLLSVVDPEHWSSLLEKSVFCSILNLTADDLPKGCRQTSVTMFRDSDSDEGVKVFNGSIDFTLPDNGTDLTGWQDALLQEISTDIEHSGDISVTPYRMPGKRVLCV